MIPLPQRLRVLLGARPVAPEPRERVLGAYLGLAVGDALGATVEFMTPTEIKAQHGIHRDITGGGWLHLKRGAVTDDTQMTLALGGAILAAGGVDARAIAEAFSAWMHAKPADIGGTVRRGLAHYRRTGDLVAPASEYAAGNGACMRALPIALALPAATEEELRHACRAQAHITHNNPVSDAGTECVVALVRDLVAGGGRAEVLARAEGLAATFPVFRFDGRRCENPSAYIAETLRAVFQAVLSCGDFEETLIDVVNRGGDADTTGAIAGMIAGALYGRHAIPGRWLRRLDPRVRAACETQARALAATSAAPGRWRTSAVTGRTRPAGWPPACRPPVGRATAAGPAG